MDKRVIYVIIVTVLVLLLGYSVYYLYTRPTRDSLQGIDIIMLEEKGLIPFMDANDVRKEIEHKGLDFTGKLIDSIDVAFIESKLRSNPIFSDVEVYISPLSRRMKVEVKQKVASFLVQNGEKSFYVSSERGLIPMNPNYSVYVPVITGDVSEEYATTELYDLVHEIEQDADFRGYFGQIHYDKQKGIILVPRIAKTSIILGHSHQYKKMLNKYKVFRDKILKRVGINAYEYIKLAYHNQIVALPRNRQSDEPN